MNATNITRRQHYVWKHYLRAWETQGRVCVQRKDGSQFETNPDNVAVMKDFYRLPFLSEADEAFIARIINNFEQPFVKKKSLLGLDTIAAPSRLRRILKRKRIDIAEIEAEIEKVELQSEESFHSTIESDAVRLLKKLRSGATNLWQNDDDAMDFAFFISLQHMRTKRMRDLVAAGFSEGSEREIAKRIWPVLRLIFATNLGWCFFAERTNWRLRILNACDRVRFITSDQPIRNLLPGNHHNSLALFYPIEPSRAVLLEHVDNESTFGCSNELSYDVIHRLNCETYDCSHEQVFGTDKTYLASVSAIMRSGHSK